MSEPLSNVNTPLSYKLGIYRKEAHDPRLCIPEDWKGYNKCVRDLDQLSPDVIALAKVLWSMDKPSLGWNNYKASKDNSMESAYIKKAQEIINKMSEWIVKKG